MGTIILPTVTDEEARKMKQLAEGYARTHAKVSLTSKQHSAPSPDPKEKWSIIKSTN